MSDKERKINIKPGEKIEYKVIPSNSVNPQPLTQEKFEEVKLVETIGRYDSLAELKIPLTQYSQTEASGEYGIKYKPSIHDNAHIRIRDTQEEAAKRFLSELRGFGLLADCVGSGKTYEACVVISELAVRGNIENLLIIVPDSALLEKWKRVVEMDFGLGKDRLQIIKGFNAISEKMRLKVDDEVVYKPKGSYIMLYEDFAKEGAGANMLFDMVVVDEAHNLRNKLDGRESAMYYLSLMMLTKKKCAKPYCLLLTATPHTGNLEDMFALWYFIRCKGGTPECFKEGGQQTAEYKEEYAYYHEIVCKGASTVAEYIDRAQCEQLIVEEEDGVPVREKFFATFKSVDGQREFPPITLDDYQNMSKCEQKARAREFLLLDENEALAERISKTVNNLYTNVVMGSIMVRRRNRYSTARIAHSYFFLPVQDKVALTSTSRKTDGRLTVDGNAFDGNEFLKVACSGMSPNRGKLFDENKHFQKAEGRACIRGYANFYYDAFRYLFADTNVDDYVHIDQIPCDVKAEKKAIFDAKCAKFVEIIRELDKTPGDNHRTIVFFDYKTEENDGNDEALTSWNRLAAYLEKKAPTLARRIIHGTARTERDCIERYNGNANAILLAEDLLYTEGQDLQTGSVIINFEVPADPLTMDQRIGRVHRLGQSDDVRIYSFSTMSRLDGYCLAYYAAAGILSDRNGDATILSGCNSDRMRAIRCPNCHDMTLIYENDYDELLPWCPDCEAKGEHVRMEPRTRRGANGVHTYEYVCRKNKDHVKPVEHKVKVLWCNNCAKEPLMETITINEFVCEKDMHHRIRRTGKNYDYVCMSSTQEKLTRFDEGENKVGCSKFCAFKQCDYTVRGCPLRKVIDSVVTETEAQLVCLSCDKREDCDCRIDHRNVSESCARCNVGKQQLRCGITPYAIEFGSDYTRGRCPICHGKLKQISANTFETFIMRRYENDKDFCAHFKSELAKTLQIKKIITFDK